MDIRTICICASAALALSSCGGSDYKKTTSENDDIKTLAEQLTENINSGVFSIDLNITNESTTSPCKVTSNKESSYVAMSDNGVYTEFYSIGDEGYMLFPDINFYKKGDSTMYGSDFISSMLTISEGDTLSKRADENGKIIEVYTSAPNESRESESYSFTFDEESGTIKSITASSAEGIIKFDINSINFVGADIRLPDLDGWKNLDDAMDEASALKYTLYCSYGLTEDVLTENGYSYEKLTEMTDQEIEKLIEEIESADSQN